MRCGVSLDRDASGVVARCAEYPACEGRGATAAEALERLRASLLFWLEACPCDTTTGPGLVLDVVRDGTRAG
jgi:predicted RNase H-like HicB family nuclease